MNAVSLIPVIMPILAAIIIMVIAVVFIVVNGRTRQVQNLAIQQKAFEELTNELKADHARMNVELKSIREELHSINKMMAEVQ